MVNAVTRDGAALAVVAGLEVTSTGVSIGASLALRTVLVGTLAVAFTLTTDGARLMTSLHQHARLGARPTFAVLAGYRVLEDLPERWTTIRRAQSVRDPRHRPGALPRDPGSLLRAAFTLLVVALRQGERLAIAMETRGLGSGPRTVHRPVRLGRRDAAVRRRRARCVRARGAGVVAHRAAAHVGRRLTRQTGPVSPVRWL